MSHQNDWVEWHLTPRGWELGTTKLFGPPQEVVPPADRVLTCQYREYMSYWSSPTEETVTELWRSEVAAEVSRLLNMHGPCPRRLAA